MFEEHSVAGAGVPSVVDVDLVAAVVITCVANGETTGCVWCPRLIRSAKQDDIYGASNIILPCPGS